MFPGSSKRPCGSETKAVSKKIRLTDEEIIDLLMSKVIEAQTVSKNTDIMESSVELPVSDINNCNNYYFYKYHILYMSLSTFFHLSLCRR